MFTIEQLVNEVRKLVAEQPNFVYDNEYGCRYVNENAPGCIVGQAIMRLNPELRDVLEENSISRVNYLLWHLKFIKHPNVLLPQEVKWLMEVQKEQDEKYRWEDAVKNADKYFPLDESTN